MSTLSHLHLPLHHGAVALSPARRLAEQALSRAAGAPLIGGNALELLIDGEAHFRAWLAAIRRAQRVVLLENYIVRDDPVGQEFREALVERAAAGVRVRVMRDWLGCFGLSRRGFWKPLLDAGGELRVYNPPRIDDPISWINRDHRKLLVVDGVEGFLSGVCLSQKWLGDPERGVPPWRDTGVAIRGPAVAELVAAFGEIWAQLGAPLDQESALAVVQVAGDVDLRVIATMPSTSGIFRLDQLIAAMAKRTLWLTDAYFVGLPPYVQALIAAERDGVDVRLLVPGASDVPAVAAMSRAGYRPLLEAGVRVFEWNGSMLHAKTAVADGRWARVGSSNLNIASWLGNCEIDVAIEDERFAGLLAEQYERDLANATEIVLAPLRRVRCERPPPPNPRRPGGSASRAAAGALRLAHSVGSVLSNQRVLAPADTRSLPGIAFALVAVAMIAIWWPRLIAWPLAMLALWFGASFVSRWLRVRRAARLAAERSAASP